jgi:hypothetical protein
MFSVAVVRLRVVGLDALDVDIESEPPGGEGPNQREGSGPACRNLGSRTQLWIHEDWMQHHSTWKRTWRTGSDLAKTDEESASL